VKITNERMREGEASMHALTQKVLWDKKLVVCCLGTMKCKKQFRSNKFATMVELHILQTIGCNLGYDRLDSTLKS
jgi:hypothetical protein